MVAVMLVGVALTVMMQLREEAVGRAANGRDLSVVARLSSQLLHKMEAAMFPDVFDGMVGDFSEQGYPEFTWLIAVGDTSNFANRDAVDSDSPEWAWREALEKREDDRVEEDGDDILPEKTRVVIIVEYPGYDLETREYRLEAMLESWAVFQDFELYEELWGSNNETGEFQ